MSDALEEDPRKPWRDALSKTLRYYWDQQGADYYDLQTLLTELMYEVNQWEVIRRDELQEEDDEDDD